MNKDLTMGKPETVLWRFCLPLLGSIVFQQLYNIADSLIAGRFIGEDALAAVGNGYQITLLFIAFAFGCNIGCSVIVSQLFGAKEYGQVKTAIYTTWIFSGILCVLLMLIGICSCSSLLTLIHTPVDIFNDSKLYLDIYIFGLPFLMFYNVSNGIFSALGDSKTPFYFLAFSSTANIIVDVWFVKGFQMGIAGVAWATFLCQGLSCILAMYVVTKRLKTMQTQQKNPLFSFDIFRKIVVIAIPSILQQGFICVGNIIIQGRINDFGSGVIAGYSAAVKMNNLVITSFTTLGNGISNYTAQNLGAGELSRIRDGFRAGIKMVWMICVPVVLIYMLGSGNLVRVFMDTPSKEAMTTGVQFLHILSPFYLVVSAKLVTDGVLRGVGRMKQFMIATFTDLVIRVVLAFLLSGLFGSKGIWMSWPVGWIVATIMSLRFYRQEARGKQSVSMMKDK